MTPFMRIAHALLALAALAGIIFSYIAGPSVPTAEPLRTLRFLSFFTISTNSLVLWAAVGRLLPPGRRWHELATRPACAPRSQSISWSSR